MNKLLWLDLEMTGLDENIHHIIEIAAMVTDLDFRTVDSFHRVVYQPPEVLAKMDDWCVKTHGASGLTDSIPRGAPLANVERDLMTFLDPHFTKDFRIILCGNSIGNDRRFIDRYMTLFSSHLHYRMIDVSSFKEIFREKFGIYFKKENKHRALDDVQASIDELKTYIGYVQVPKK